MGRNSFPQAACGDTSPAPSITMRTCLLSCFLFVSPLSAAVVEHGPLVHWNQDPAKSCRIVWMERAGQSGEEGKWALGPAGFGYGDDDDTTVFGRMKGRFLSLAIRRAVKLPPGADPKAVLVLRVNYDDGFIAWFGDREIARRNIVSKDGKIRAQKSHEAGTWEDIPLGRADRFLGAEGGVLALQGFSNEIESSDFTLHAVLVAKSGRKEWLLVVPGQAWEYLANAAPEEGWKNRTLDLASAPEPATKSFTLRHRAKGVADWKNTAVVSEPFADSQHRVLSAELAGLPAGRDIEFQILEKSAGESEVYRFRMPPQVGGSIRFITGGDLYHSRVPMDMMNRRAGKEDPLFALIGGDLAYANDMALERWFGYVDSWAANARTPDGRLVPKIIAIGNHETLGAGYHPNDAPGPEAARMFYSLFQFPEKKNATHAVDFGSWLSLVMLDSGHTKTIASQTAWLEKTLSGRRGVPNVFVAYHRPAWGSGTKDDSKEIQREWCPPIERHRATAVFEYDHHVFCRTHPIKGGVIDETNGIPYLGSGAWSVTPRPVDPRKLEQRPWVAAALPVNHFYVIETKDHGYTATAKDIAGNVIDCSERVWKR
jgi:hypothetical protein